MLLSSAGEAKRSQEEEDTKNDSETKTSPAQEFKHDAQHVNSSQSINVQINDSSYKLSCEQNSNSYNTTTDQHRIVHHHEGIPDIILQNQNQDEKPMIITLIETTDTG